MNIYLVKRHCGSYENYFERNVKAFKSKENAENYKKNLERIEESERELYDKCRNCPMFDYKREFKTFDELKEYLGKYCGKFKLANGDTEQIEKIKII